MDSKLDKLELVIDCLKFIPSETGGTVIVDVKAEPGGYLGCGKVEIWRNKLIYEKVATDPHINVKFPDAIYPDKYYRETFKRALIAAAAPYKKAMEEGRCPHCKKSNR